MKKAKLNKVPKKEEIEIQDSYSIKQFLMIIIIIAVIFGIFYFITYFVAKPKNNEIQNSSTVIDNQMITLNHLLDRKENEYYVLATKSSLYNNHSNLNYHELYNKYINEYSNKDGSLKFYKINLNDALNKKYLGEETIISQNLDDLKLSDEVLFKIKNGTIEESFVGNKDIIKELSNI